MVKRHQHDGSQFSGKHGKHGIIMVLFFTAGNHGNHGIIMVFFLVAQKKLYPCFSDDKLSIKFQRISKFSPTKVDDLSAFLAISEEQISKFSPTMVDDLSAFLAFSEEQISKFSRCRVPCAIFAMQNIMVFFHFGTGIIMVYHGIFFWNLLRTMHQ